MGTDHPARFSPGAGEASEVNDPSFLVVGEALVDVVPAPDGARRDMPGGSPANVALTLGRLGRRVRLATTLGTDQRGREIRGWLESSGVEVDAAVPASGRTSSAAVTLDDHGSATYDFDLSWDLPGVQSGDATVLHVGSIAALLHPGAQVVQDLVTSRHQHCLVSLDPNVRPALITDEKTARANVETLVGFADVVKVSDEDLSWYEPGTDPVAVAARWATAGPGLIVLTRGDRGAVAVRHDGHRVETPPVRVRVSDTVGAGDTFVGALIHALAASHVHGPAGGRLLRGLSDDQIERALRTAVVAASINVSRPGADPPRRDELAAAMLEQ